jgi:hypothetical protein
MSENGTGTSSEQTLAADNAAVIKHMEMYQGIITRMANNSAACKSFAIPLITAILGFMITEKQVALMWLSILPIFLFYFIDTYYLVLENQFRDSFNVDGKSIQKGTFTKESLFDLSPFKKAEADHPKETDIEKRNQNYLLSVWSKCLKSNSTLVVYVGLLFLIAIAYSLANFTVTA